MAVTPVGYYEERNINTFIPFVDLRAQYESIESEIDEVLRSVVRSAQFIGGEPLVEFETKFAKYCGTAHAIGVANGTDALQLALRALDIGHGDEVITVANTFIATAAAIATVGAKPVFVDIDPATHTIDPELMKAAITARTKAVIPVHLYGQPAEMRPIMDIARSEGLKVVEDAAQAHGAAYAGERVGSIGDVACFSFYPGKNLGAYGDGGAITTNASDVSERVTRLRDHGRITKYEHAEVGFNSRLDALQAAVLTVKLKYLDEWNNRRRQVAEWYDSELEGTAIKVPRRPPDRTSVYHLYVIESDMRDVLKERLDAAGVASGIHYPQPLHLQPAFAHLEYPRGSLPQTEAVADRILSLPIFPELSRDQVTRVAELVRKHA